MKLTLLAGALALAATTAAFANDPAKPAHAEPGATFQALDVNGDGRISAEEARAHNELNADFRGAVTDSERGMTQAEFDTWAKSRKPATRPPGN